MQTELAQIISLASFGNEFLKGGQVPSSYYPDSTVFEQCSQINFTDFKKPLFSKQTENVVANSPLEWFKILKMEGCIKLRICHRSARINNSDYEYNLAGFVGGGGTWLIEANFGKYSHFYHKRWQLVNSAVIDHKTWSVNYSRLIKKSMPSIQIGAIDKIETKFRGTLSHLINFCRIQELSYWLEVFVKAESMFSDTTPNTHYYHHDLIVTKNYSLKAQRLLFSAGTSWVFGGMGWWNDMSFEDKDVQKLYLKLSQTHYEQLIQSITVATNSV